MTRLERPLRREVPLDGCSYTLTVDPQGMKLVRKGRRKGVRLGWREIVSGDAGLARAQQASLDGS